MMAGNQDGQVEDLKRCKVMTSYGVEPEGCGDARQRSDGLDSTGMQLEVGGFHAGKNHN
jgi:hypothetical protein